MWQFSILVMISLGFVPVSARATDCRVTGKPSSFRVDVMAFFAVRSGETWNFPIRIPGHTVPEDRSSR